MALLEAVDWGLRLHEGERPQSVEEWLAAMGEREFAPAAPSRGGSAAPPKEGAGEEPDDEARRAAPEPTGRGAEEARHHGSWQAKLGLGIGAIRKRAWEAVALGIAALMLLVVVLGQDHVDELGAWRGSAATPVTSPPPLVRSFTVTNQSAQKIVVVRAAPTTMDNYGDNKLGTATISPGRKHRVLLDKYGYGDACEFDVFINAEDRQTHEERKDFDLCRNDELVFGGDNDEESPPGVDRLGGRDDTPTVVAAPPPVVECTTCQPLTVRTGPSDARVQITNIGPRYEPGIKLPPGSYDIRVTADGFETVTRTLRHGDEPTDEWISLPFRDCPVCPTMVELPTGEYEMGTGRGPERYSNEGPAHHVAILYPFAVGVFEVSFEEWDACLADGGCTRRLRDEERGRGTRPAVNVAVVDTTEYINWLTVRTGRPYRLLSEAEWEYAARAGTRKERHWATREDQCDYENGADETAQNEHSNWTIVGCTDGYVYAAPSDEDRFRPNPWGLHHMLGNVSEWTADCWHQSYLIRLDGRELRAPTDGSAWTQDCGPAPVRHVVRGGSWSSIPRGVRAPVRLNRDPAESANHIGFRVAVEITR